MAQPANQSNTKIKVMRYFILIAMLFVCTSFFSRQKTYWLCTTIIFTTDKEIHVAEIIEAQTKNEADREFKRWINATKERASGKIDKSNYWVRQIWDGMIHDKFSKYN